MSAEEATAGLSTGKKRKGGALLVLAVLLLAVTALAWRFRQEISAFGVSRKYTTTELEEQLGASDSAIREAVEAVPEVMVRVPTDEEKQALRDGSLSHEELVSRLTESVSAPPQETETQGGESLPAVKQEQPTAMQEPSVTPPETAEPDAETPEEVSQEPSDYSRRLSELIAEVYVLRESYVNALEAMEEDAKADYRALDKSERSKTKLAPLVSDYLARAAALEKECDAKIDAIVTEMEALIAANNGDMSLTDTVFDTYINEKSLKKAWYMSRLQEKGLV